MQQSVNIIGARDGLTINFYLVSSRNHNKRSAGLSLAGKERSGVFCFEAPMRTVRIVSIGDRFGRLVVLSSAGYRSNGEYLNVRCDCGTEKPVRKATLYSGSAISCGCSRKGRGLKHGHAIVKDGKRTPEYEAWAHMLRRCHTKTNKQYSDYGGRGITVCDRWRYSYENFFADMGPRPSKLYSLERKNNEKGYFPKNCKWALREEQNNNTRRSRRITFRDKTQSMTQWERELGIPRGRIAHRLNRGMTGEQALVDLV